MPMLPNNMRANELVLMLLAVELVDLRPDRIQLLRHLRGGAAPKKKQQRPALISQGLYTDLKRRTCLLVHLNNFL